MYQVATESTYQDVIYFWPSLSFAGASRKTLRAVSDLYPRSSNPEKWTWTKMGLQMIRSNPMLTTSLILSMNYIFIVWLLLHLNSSSRNDMYPSLMMPQSSDYCYANLTQLEINARPTCFSPRVPETFVFGATDVIL